MKKYLFFIGFLMGAWLPQTGHAQNNFAPVGAEWWYGGSLFDYSFWDDDSWRWADQMQSVKDTSIAGRSARMLTAVRYMKTTWNPNLAQVRYRDTFFVYNNEDTVFAYDKMISDFTPLYVFNVNVGDTACLRKPNAGSAIGEVTFCIIIDSIKLELYDTALLRSYYNHTIPDPSVSLYDLNWGGPRHTPGQNDFIAVGKYTEKIGGNWAKLGSFFPGKCVYNPDYYKESEEIPTGAFRCYYDPVTAIKIEAISCDSVIKPFVSISELKKSAYNISVFPNPNHGSFSLTMQKPSAQAIGIQVTDLSGRTITRLNLPAGQKEMKFDLGESGSGIYLLVLSTQEQRYYQKLVITR